MKDAENGNIEWIDTSSKVVRTQFKANYLKHEAEVLQLFRRSGVDTINIRTDEDYVKPLINFFKRREK